MDPARRGRCFFDHIAHRFHEIVHESHVVGSLVQKTVAGRKPMDQQPPQEHARQEHGPGVERRGQRSFLPPGDVRMAESREISPPVLARVFGLPKADLPEGARSRQPPVGRIGKGMGTFDASEPFAHESTRDIGAFRTMRSGHDLFRQNVVGVGSGCRQENRGAADVAPVNEQRHAANSSMSATGICPMAP